MWEALKRFRAGSTLETRPAASRSDFLNLWPWGPNGYISGAEERGQAYRSYTDPSSVKNEYAARAAHWIDRGDEVFGGSPYAYTPLDLEASRGANSERVYAFTGLVSEPEPQTPQWPAISSLIDSAYGSLNSLWQRIAADNAISNDW